MNNSEIKARGVAFEAGYFDSYMEQGKARWLLLHLRTPTDREMSDYWEGFHRGNRDLREGN